MLKELNQNRLPKIWENHFNNPETTDHQKTDSYRKEFERFYNIGKEHNHLLPKKGDKNHRPFAKEVFKEMFKYAGAKVPSDPILEELVTNCNQAGYGAGIFNEYHAALSSYNANSGLIDEVNHGRYNKLFCLVDDFCRDIEKNFAGKLLPNGKKPTRTTEIEHSEIMTIILLYQQSPCKNFKTFYLHYLTLLYKSEFPKLPSYTRFVALKPRVLWHLAMLLHWLCGQSENTGISYIDTTPIAVCHAKRISKNKVFAGIAKLSKSTYGWFFGFKLHMVINENGEIHSLTLTKGNVDDRIPVPNLTEKLTGLLFGDKGYIAKELFQKLFDRGLKLVTKVKKGMKNALISLNEKILLRKRSIIETVFGYLKNRLEIEHTRHRSPVNFLVHIFSTLISYSIKSKKPSISYTFFLP